MDTLKTGINLVVKKTLQIMSPEPRVEFSEDSDNGMVFNDIPVPEELISRIFCYYVDAKSLLNCQLVCKRWNMLMTDYVWRKKAIIRTGHHFTLEEPYDWKDYYSIITVNFGKNLLTNHSGAEGIRKGWNNLRNGGDGWKIERSPLGVPPLPEEPDFGNSQYCFVTSYSDCIKEQTIYLSKVGFSANVLDSMQPVIEISEWYGCRWDCPANYKLTVQLIGSQDQIMDSFIFKDSLENERQNVWHKVEHKFTNYGRGLRIIRFKHGGSDRYFWAGHYGSKMARATVKVIIP
ncbi:F-box only protein 44-like [Contarinia nasturtii]|uniref:F-box only protein 44-like n=1 Tax=Contarinia nasturtii TaxID=265458 RepID=UPI0012D48682|nr:F-box only protein 44-like [Contarinia nasturtii]